MVQKCDMGAEKNLIQLSTKALVLHDKGANRDLTL